jgi:rod shape determining protein RodA
VSWVSGQARSRPLLPWAALRRAAARAARRGSAVRQTDWVLLASVLALSGTGTVLIWSATAPLLSQQGLNQHGYLFKQALNVVLGLILMTLASSLERRQLKVLAPAGYVLSCLGLVAVLTPLGSVVNGARGWITLGAGFQIEPAEFATLAVIMMAALILGRRRDDRSPPGMRALAVTAALAAVPVALVVAEPALGSTIVLSAVAAVLVTLSGIRPWLLAGLAGAGAAAMLAVLQLGLLKSYQISRLTSFANPAADPRGTGYSAAQARIAIGSGGLFGKGLFHGPLVAGSFVPEQHTDFIFAVAGNELGFAGAVLIIGLLGVLLLRALRIAARAEDQFGLLLAAGIAVWFAVQSFVNIGMTVGIMPVTGLPLPLVSYGGSAMFADMIAVGLLQAVHRRRCLFR